ncbi:MAG: hypothetical protein P4K94_08180 [Terracidiphilus sp.]|nr:hypothetical protein [Terracidiphilus sp.]
MRKSFLALVFLAICPLLAAQQALNNDSVIKLVKAGLSDDLIVSTINAQAGSYDTSTDGLITLKTAGVSDKVVAAIVAKAAAPPTAPVPVPPPAPIAPAPVVQAAAPQAPPPPPFHSTDGKIRLYVTDHPIFESNGIAKASGDRHGGSAAAATHTVAGDDPRTVEIQADILKVCPAFVMASNNPDRADYVLIFRRRGGSRSSMFAFGGLYGLAFSAAMKVDGASLFQNDGDMVYATKQTTVEKSIQDICAHIPAPVRALAPQPTLTPIPPPPPATL